MILSHLLPRICSSNVAGSRHASGEEQMERGTEPEEERESVGPDEEAEDYPSELHQSDLEEALRDEEDDPRPREPEVTDEEDDPRPDRT